MYLQKILSTQITAGKIHLTADGDYDANYDPSIAMANAATAQAAADTAQSDADDAQADATTSLNSLADIARDTKITPVEKLTAKPLWDDILVEGTATTGTIPAQAIVFSVSHTNFDTAYATLNTYLNTTLGVFDSMTATTTIVRADWNTAWKNYYNERTLLLNAIATKAKSLADDAQGTADTALADAGTAITNAATAQGTADGKVTTFYQDAEPTAEGYGDLWVDTNDKNKLYRWTDLATDAWVEVRDTDIAQAIADAGTAQSTADGKIVTFYADAQPTAEGYGDLWYDTNDGNKLYRWNDLATDAWVEVKPELANAAKTGKWYSSSGVSLNASSGINIWGTNNALTTRATEAGTIQCSVGANGKISAGAGTILLGSDGLRILGQKLYFDSTTTRGYVYGSSSGMHVISTLSNDLNLLSASGNIKVWGHLLNQGSYDLGSPASEWRNLYVSGSTVLNGYTSISNSQQIYCKTASGLLIPHNSSATTAAEAGKITFRTATSKFEGWDGSAWQAFH